MIAASLLAVLLTYSPPAEGAADPPAPSVSAGADVSHDADYLATKDEVRAAMQKANDDPTNGAASLRNALTKLQRYEIALADDPEGQELRTIAQLTLARALMAAEDPEGARAIMDEAIRTARGDPMPTATFGPGLTALHKERLGALDKQGAGSIAITCNVDCKVYVNERPAASNGLTGLLAGKYRLYIVDPSGATRALQQSVEVTDGGQITLEFGTAPVIAEPPPPPPPPPLRRIMPRWAEITLMAGGAVAMGVGGALIGIHERCPDLSSPLADPQCPEVYLTRTAGIVTLAAGGAVFLTGTITLAIDEVKLARNKQQPPAMSLLWTMRF